MISIKNLFSTNYFFRILKRILYGPFDKYLNKIDGIIHIGANEGQERDHYNKYKLKNILWIEADPFIFKKLKKNISPYSNQRALNYLVSNKNKLVNFYISNANGNASSILNINIHKKMYPNIKFIKKIFLKSFTLPCIIKKEFIKIKKFQALSLDTQGSELLILQGAKKILKNFHYIKLECADFEIYKNCAKYNEISSFLSKIKFKESKKILIDSYKNGKVFDVLYKNQLIK